MEMKKKRKISRMKNNINWEREEPPLPLPLPLPFPYDVIQLIFSKLPFVNLPNCRLVSKAWNNLVLTRKFDHPSISTNSNLFFAHVSPYRNLHCVDFDPKHMEGISSVAKFSFCPEPFSKSTRVSIINSCRGLLCCSFYTYVTSGARVWILNPMTNEYLKTPGVDTDDGSYYYGFGFSPRTKQFKLARLSYACYRPFETLVLVEIFAFGTCSEWTPVSLLPSQVEEHGVYFNGGLYWVGFVAIDITKVIYRLNVEDGEFQKISFPQHHHCSSCFLGVFDGALHLTLSDPGLHDFTYHVWRMEEQDFSWRKVFVILKPRTLHRTDHVDPSPRLQLIRVCEDGNILCLFSGLHLVLYDPKTDRVVEILTPQPQDVEIKKFLWVHPIDSFHFGSLRSVLAGDASTKV